MFVFSLNNQPLYCRPYYILLNILKLNLNHYSDFHQSHNARGNVLILLSCFSVFSLLCSSFIRFWFIVAVEENCIFTGRKLPESRQFEHLKRLRNWWYSRMVGYPGGNNLTSPGLCIHDWFFVKKMPLAYVTMCGFCQTHNLPVTSQLLCERSRSTKWLKMLNRNATYPTKMNTKNVKINQTKIFQIRYLSNSEFKTIKIS